MVYNSLMKGADTLNKNKFILQNPEVYDAFMNTDDTKTSPVHYLILRRSYELLKSFYPESEQIIGPMLKYMLHVVKKPDQKGDRENGLGKHYYCAVSAIGADSSPFLGYYKNGLGHFAPSARTMFEEDYTMALTMYKSGYIRQAASYLGRAVHMLSDMCCLPHATGMTYFSPKKGLHQAYERLAAIIYPDKIDECGVIPQALDVFSNRNSFSKALNTIAEECRNEKVLLYSDIKKAVTMRLHETEFSVTALLKRFCEDTFLPPEIAHYIVSGMQCRLSDDLPILTTEVTEKGIIFKQNHRMILAHVSKNKVCGNFTVAHRLNGRYTISYFGENQGRVLKYGGSEWPAFDPRNKKQMFKFSLKQPAEQKQIE